jgi:aspartate kinase
MNENSGRIVIQKYGGTSVENPERLKKVAEKIILRKEHGDQLVVVVSAMGNTTDELIELAHRVSSAPSRRELDMLISVGERISMTLLAMAINDLGHQAISFTGSQSGIITTDTHTNARILEVRASRIRDELNRGKVVIVAGYQGVSTSREVTTLGRGGSDTTAIALAAALDASVCEIYTDVEGVFTADPGIVRDARKHDRLTYDEMLALSATGGVILKKEAMEFARRHRIKMEIRSSLVDNTGTRIVERVEQRENPVIGVMQESGLVALLLHGDRTRDEALDFIGEISSSGIEVRDFILDCSDEDSVARHLFIALVVTDDHGHRHVRAVADRLLGGSEAKLFRCGSVSIVSCLNAYLPELYCRVLKILSDGPFHVYGMKKEFGSVTAYIDEGDVANVSKTLHELLIP